jgi:nitrate/nitrite transporter NarK
VAEMGSVTSAVGICIDMIGAVVLVFALYKRSAPLAPGDARTPAEFAHDLAIGFSGAVLLVAGFAFQLAAAFGYQHHRPRETVLYACLAAFAIAPLVGWLVYRGARPIAEDWERSHRPRSEGDQPPG